jgi:hypothetical protein
VPIVVLDGPEKAGKTTLANLLVSEYGATRRHFTAEPEAGELYDLTFLRALIADSRSPGIVVWDRSWASEAVYGGYFGRDRRAARDPWIAEWLYGRAVATLGVRVMLLGPSVDRLHGTRTPDDHHIPVAVERRLFEAHAQQYGWEYCIENHHTLSAAASTAHALVTHLQVRGALLEGDGVTVPDYVGPPDPRVLVVGESRNAWGHYPGGWAPFTSWYTTRFGRLFGPPGINFGWTNADVVSPDIIDRAEHVVACGAVAHKAVRLVRRDALEVPHPAWFYRWGSARASVPEIETRLLDTVRGWLGERRSVLAS